MTETSAAIPDLDRFDGDIYLRHQRLPSAEWASHAHPWGQLNYVSQGVMHIEVGGERFVSPPQYGVWVPPHVRHTAASTLDSTYRSAYLSLEFSKRLPKRPCALSISPLLKAVLDEFARLDVVTPVSRQEKALGQVALDQIEAAQLVNAYLPFPTSESLAEILSSVQGKLRERRSTQQIAEAFHLTARTLERRCLSELGIGFGEWQQRARHLRAIELLDAGETVQATAYELGYASSSAFIGMFRRLTGLTPDRYRRRQSGDV